MIKTIEKIIPRQISFLLMLCGVTDLISYYGGKLLSPLFETHIWELPIDAMIPTRPLWAVVYFLSFVLWVVNYILVCRSDYNIALRLVAADTVCKVIGLLLFVFLPCTIDRPNLDAYGAEASLLRLLYAIDEPTALFPSFHCILSWLCTRSLLHCKNIKLPYKAFCVVFCVLIFLSTLFTKQHVFVDVIAGVLLAELSFDLVVHTKLIPAIGRFNEFMSGRFKDSNSSAEL